MHSRQYTFTLAAVLAFLLILPACGDKSKPQNGSDAGGEGRADGRVHIVTTTAMIADAVENLLGEQAAVESLMGPGVDPHLYKTTHGDLERLEAADIVIYNGLHLEGKMVEVLEQLAADKPVIAMAELLRTRALMKVNDFEGSYDPHIWFNVPLWTRAVKLLRDSLDSHPGIDGDAMLDRSREYESQLDSTHQFIMETLADIPTESRILVTAHDAFGYFGAAYDFEVQGLQGLSTLSEFGLRDRVELVDMIVRRNIKAIFVETSVSTQAIDAVIESAAERGHELKIGGKLFSDAMGAPGTVEGTYIGMVRANARTIAAGLK